jgi:aspartyl/asparaginyl-tRNA synthetase
VSRYRSVRRSSFVVRISFVIVILLPIFAANCHAAAVWSSNELIEKARELDGRELSYSGELVTAILNRADYAFINLNDGSNAIGVWCKSSALNSVKFAGSYKRKGDILEVRGEFHRACPYHNGELDIHADEIKIVKSGYSLEEHIDQRKIKSSIGIFIIILLTVIIFRKRL